MENSWRVRVTESKEIRRDDSIEYFSPTWGQKYLQSIECDQIGESSRTQEDVLRLDS